MKRVFFIFVLSLAMVGSISAQSRLQKILADANKMKEVNNVPLALAKYQQALNIVPDNYEALWNASVLCSKMGRNQNQEEVRDKYYLDAKRMAERAVRTNENGARGYYALALALDQYADIVGAKERVTLIPDIKVNALNALRLDPRMADGWHMLGRWNWRVSNFSFAEKTAYNLQHGGQPKGASNDYAARCFSNAIEQESDVILFHHDLAQVYNTVGNSPKTKEECLKCINLRNISQDDAGYKADCADWLRSLGY